MSSLPSSGRDEAEEITEEPSTILRFDVIAADSSDHHFANSSSSAKKNLSPPPHPKVTPEVQKRIAHEWRLLAENLPETILARTYEHRIDLLRAVIIGAAGTPYHDGLYFFDVMFPQGYPACPPKVYYRSYGYRINPNLYYSGKVCLSLLNTWFGRNSSEKWDPKTSTALQVLLSLQALVLNERPYFNEPAITGSRWDPLHKRSNAYNEQVFLLSCRTMTHVMNRPPMGFESIVKDHFRDRGHVILDACESYFAGRDMIGRFGSVDIDASKGKKLPRPSEKLRSGLLEVYPILVTWFERCEADIGRTRVLRATDDVEDKKRKVKDGRIKVVMGRVWGKVNRIIGLKG